MAKAEEKNPEKQKKKKLSKQKKKNKETNLIGITEQNRNTGKKLF